jgi:hypothetical protein
MTVAHVQPMLTRQRESARMLSPASLTAFSTGAAQAALGQMGAVHRVRAVGAQQPQPITPGASSTAAQPSRDNDAPGRPLPRGSLLDLSV